MPPRKYIQFPTRMTDEDVDDIDNDTPTPDVFGYDDFVEGE